MTLVIAHRGASRAEPENTLAAFRRAGAMGADAVELDLRRTADDRLVVHHDAWLADGGSLRAVRAGDLPAFVPALDEALDACAGMAVNIEIKNDPTEPDYDPTDWVAHRVCQLLAARRDPISRWLVSSFRGETVDTCRMLLPGLRTALLTDDCSDESVARAAGRHQAIHPDVDSLDAQRVRVAHAQGLLVNTWTCDDPERIRELLAWGVDGICTNVPDIALDVRRSITRAAQSCGDPGPQPARGTPT